ncbi:MAG: hypothetical protein U0031_12335 [Thermomicrobiales bacterium]
MWAALLVAVPILVSGLALTVGLRLGRPPVVDNDYWWHLATGEWILDHRAIPTVDPFSGTHGGQPWVAHEWLAGVILAVVVASGGYAGALIFTWIVAVAGFWRLLTGVRAYGMSRRALCALMVLCGCPLIRQNVMTPRPQLWAFTLFAILLACLCEYETGRRRVVWYLPLVFAIWINVNLSALIGIACLGAFALDRLLRRELERPLLIASLLSVAALLVNPQGIGLVTAVIKYADPDASRYERIFEWMPPARDDPTHWGLFLALTLAPVAVFQIARGRIWPTLPLLALAYQAWTAVRFIPLYMMVAFVFAGWLVWRGAFGMKPVTEWTPLIPRSFWTGALALNAAAVVILIASFREESQFRREPDLLGFPVAPAEIILEDYPTARLFNAYDFGGYLLHRFDGQQLVFIDGREEMYGEPFMARYWDLIDGAPGWEDAFAADGITVALVRPWDGLADRLDEDADWTESYADDDAILYVQAR